MFGNSDFTKMHPNFVLEIIQFTLLLLAPTPLYLFITDRELFISMDLSKLILLSISFSGIYILFCSILTDGISSKLDYVKSRKFKKPIIIAVEAVNFATTGVIIFFFISTLVYYFSGRTQAEKFELASLIFAGIHIILVIILLIPIPKVLISDKKES